MTNLVVDILNYAVRLSIIVLGVLIAGGFVMQIPEQKWYSTGTGALLIVFGLYRLLLYYLGVRRRTREEMEDSESEELFDKQGSEYSSEHSSEHSTTENYEGSNTADSKTAKKLTDDSGGDQPHIHSSELT